MEKTACLRGLVRLALKKAQAIELRRHSSAFFAIYFLVCFLLFSFLFTNTSFAGSSAHQRSFASSPDTRSLAEMLESYQKRLDELNELIEQTDFSDDTEPQTTTDQQREEERQRAEALRKDLEELQLNDQLLVPKEQELRTKFVGPGYNLNNMLGFNSDNAGACVTTVCGNGAMNSLATNAISSGAETGRYRSIDGLVDCILNMPDNIDKIAIGAHGNPDNVGGLNKRTCEVVGDALAQKNIKYVGLASCSAGRNAEQDGNLLQLLAERSGANVTGFSRTVYSSPNKFYTRAGDTLAYTWTPGLVGRDSDHVGVIEGSGGTSPGGYYGRGRFYGRKDYNYYIDLFGGVPASDKKKFDYGGFGGLSTGGGAGKNRKPFESKPIDAKQAMAGIADMATASSQMMNQFLKPIEVPDLMGIGLAGTTGAGGSEQLEQVD